MRTGFFLGSQMAKDRAMKPWTALFIPILGCAEPKHSI
jgi:hypothetical protein